jgi:hypothetical protein
MAWEKVTYWAAVGFLTVMACNSFVDRHQGLLSDLSDHSLQVAEVASGRATAYLSRAEMMLGRDQTRFVRTQTRMACVQTRLASMEVAVAREQAGLARATAQRARLAAVEPTRPRLFCPRPGLTMAIPQPQPMQDDGTI